MFLWDKSSRTVLTVIMGSTTHKYCFSELQKETDFWPSVLTTTLQRLTEAEVLIREVERYVGESEFRAPHVFYSLNPEIVDYLRL
jgi:DNA-binding HxlR family transcriptional regulator